MPLKLFTMLCLGTYILNCFLNGPTLAFFYLFCRFQTHITNFTTNRYVKNVYPIYGVGI